MSADSGEQALHQVQEQPAQRHELALGITDPVAGIDRLRVASTATKIVTIPLKIREANRLARTRAARVDRRSWRAAFFGRGSVYVSESLQGYRRRCAAKGR